jgi:hypothetical protein
MAKKKGFFGKSYAVMISTAPKDAQEFMSEWRQIGSALVEWKARGVSDFLCLRRGWFTVSG